MPPAIAVVAAVGAGVAAAAGVMAVTTALAISAVALAATALLNKPKMPGTGTSPSDRKQVIRSAASPMVGIQGRTQVSGVLSFAEERKNKSSDDGKGDELHLALTLAGHTQPAGVPVVKSVKKVFMDDKEIPLGSSHSGKVYVRVYDGSQTKISDLGSELTGLKSWRNDMIGKGICFAHIRLKYDNKLFPSGVPNFVFELDSNDDESLSSDAVLNYLQHHFGAADDEIDLDSFNIARPICAETVATGNGGTEPRYTANGAFNFDEPHKQVIDKMKVSAAGKLTYLYGKFGFQVGAYNGPADFVLTEDDIIGNVTVKPQPDRRSLINTCKGKHVWPDGKFQEVDFPQVYSESMIADDGEELIKDLDLEFVHSPYQCQRLAANDLARARLPVITVPCNWRAFECHLGRNIKLHMPTIGYDHRECVVEGWELDPERGVTLTLRADAPEVWTDVLGRVPVLPPDVNLPDPSFVDPVFNVRFNELEVDGEWQVNVTWEHSNPGSIFQYEVVTEKEVDGQWIEKYSGTTIGPQLSVIRQNSGNYRITIIAINRFDVKSEAVIQPFNLNTPEVSLVGIAANVDNSVYPASALIVAEVLGAGSFPAESVVYETETKTTGTDWLAAGRGTTPSCRLSSLNAGVHQARMRAIPPFGDKSAWLQTEFEVFAADQPTNLTFTIDPSFDRWGFITWGGAGQSWEISVSDNSRSTVLWNSTTTERLIWLDWLKPGLYNIAVRARAGGIVSDWSNTSQLISSIPTPTKLQFDTSNASPGSTGTLTWATSDGRPQTFDVEVLSDGVRIYASPSYSTSEPLPLLLPGTYQFRVRARWNNQLSDWASISFGYELAPGDIADFQLRALDKQAILSWSKPADDIYGAGFVQVRFTERVGITATWENASPITDRLTGNTTSVQVQLMNGTYLVKAVNSQGLWSENAAAVVSNMAASIGYNRILTREEPTTWLGDKNKATITGSVLNLQNNSSNTQPPSYTMEQPLDLGGVFTIRLQMDAYGSVYEQDFIDDRLDPIDTWAQFDGAKPGDTTLQYFVSRTDDDPSSSSAQWSEWTQFVLGEFRARAFRLQVRLLSNSDIAVGTISRLKLLADVPDRQEQQKNVPIPAAGGRITYATAFMDEAELFITGLDMEPGDTYRITNSTHDGFNIRWFNSSNAGVARSCNWLAISYGERQNG
ncbi:hypothetical protein [uncultured Endozoicomonas sp.]|uniref:hypothetical protein n=1 Tax=uncultured Endozoicomonas sp. TaxID=432652 RepID=UPI002602D749|nr:hypothetical protein [uncultured Endozoicomonas sp.]